MDEISARVRELVKRIPIAQWIYRSFFETPGSWIFATAKAGWLYDPKNFPELPPLYKLFARYFKYAQRADGQKVFGTEWVYRTICWLTRMLHLKHYARITVGSNRVYLNLTDPRSLIVPTEIIEDGEIAALIDLLAPGDTFVDVGANHGSFSIVAARKVGQNGLVVAIEPQPVLAEMIDKSLRDNGLCSFQVHQFACADRDGLETFYVPRATSGSAGVFKRHSAISACESIQVGLKRFDTALNWLAFPGRVFVKLDVEGSEVSFLEGAREFIRTKHPHIMVEVNPRSAAASGQVEDGLRKTLATLGYEHFRETTSQQLLPLARIDAGRQRNIIVMPAKTP